MRHPIKLLLLLLALLQSCAKQGNLSGGPEDNTPPELIKASSTPNYSTYFKDKTIRLTFDEFVELSNVGTQVVVSPPLVTRRIPEILLRGKTVLVKIPETENLRPNTTYTIQFGSAVKDFHKGNVAKNLRFVFSTGGVLDSLQVRGEIVDADSGNPLENISFMMYEGTDDSVVVREKPTYFSKTDKSGRFLIENVRQGVFKCVAVDDIDQNLKWTGTAERIGFLDSLLTVSDSGVAPVRIRLFTEESGFRIKEKNSSGYGVVKIECNAPPDNLDYQPDLNGIKLLKQVVADTLFYWYDLRTDTAFNLISGTDSIYVRKMARINFLKSHQLALEGSSSQQLKGKPTNATLSQHPLKPLQVVFNTPVESFDTAYWRLVADSTDVRGFTLRTDTADARKVVMESTWKSTKAYQLDILPGGITDFFGTVNTDTFSRKIRIVSEKTLGGLIVNLENLKQGGSYLLEVATGQSSPEASAFFIAEDASRKLVFPNIPATGYTLKLIEDTNRNRRWDSGSYFLGRQPENSTVKKLDPIKPGWELDTTLRMVQDALREEKK